MSRLSTQAKAKSRVLLRSNRTNRCRSTRVNSSTSPCSAPEPHSTHRGALIKNRPHFYAAQERTQIDPSFTIFVTPAAQKFYPASLGAFDKPSYDQMLNLRLDHQINSKQNAFFRYSQEWNKQTYQGCTN